MLFIIAIKSAYLGINPTDKCNKLCTACRQKYHYWNILKKACINGDINHVHR